MKQVACLIFAVLVFQLHTAIFAAPSDVTAHAEGAARLWWDNVVEIKLYTRANPSESQALVLGDGNSVTSSNFDKNRPTRFITHGWRGNAEVPKIAAVRAAYITAGDYNVITVNWGSMQSIFSKPADTVRNAGSYFAEILDFLQETSGLNPSTTQLAGHSLGAHVVSYAARVAQGRYQAVIGLDPAGSDFESNADAISVGIQSGDASHVEVIHTNGGGMGLSRVSGDSDFFVNGGRSQPGCIVDIAGLCSHIRAITLFAESITSLTGFPTNEDSEVYLGGKDLSARARGSYTVTTGSQDPYALA